jgi:hypothetical protein
MNPLRIFALLITVAIATTARADSLRGYLGVKVADAASGVLVVEVREDSPAAHVLSPGDIILALGDIPVPNRSSFDGVMTTLTAGQQIILSIQRADARLKTLAVLAAWPAEPAPVQVTPVQVAPVQVAPVQDSPVNEVAANAPQKVEQFAATERNAISILDVPGASRKLAFAAAASYTADLPFVDLRAFYEVYPEVALEARVLTRGEINFVDLGVRATLIRYGFAGLGARMQLREEHYFEGRDKLILVAGSPGLMLTLGKPSFHATFGLDLAFHMFGWVDNNPGVVRHVATGAHLYAAVEFSLSQSVGFFAEFSSRSLNFKGSDLILVHRGLTAGVIF